MITIVDLGLGNLGSIVNMLNHLGVANHLSSDPNVIRNAERLILPGVGAFDPGMKSVINRGLIEPLNTAVLVRQRPILGICLGMQMLFDGSDEGKLPGLGWIRGRAVVFDFRGSSERLRVPHMGWSVVEVLRPERLFPAGMGGERFYFAHSYHVACADAADVAGIARYGPAFTAAVEHGNVMGVQFHPEKSHRFGMRLLTSFAQTE